MMDPRVEALLDAADPDIAAGITRLRRMIYEVAASDPKIGPVQETVKWGQPAYLARKGTTLRLGQPKGGGFGLYVHCQSRVIPEFRDLFPDHDRFDGTRGVVFRAADEICSERHGWLIHRALGYHLKTAGPS